MMIKSLENIEIGLLLDTFNGAFSDYSLPMGLSRDRFEGMLRVGRFNPQVSAGAFLDDGRLVGIALNGMDEFNGERTLYDCGTGVLKQYRRQGISEKMLDFSTKAAAKAGCRKYLLEVLCENTAALAAYHKAGFHEARRLVCMSAPQYREKAVHRVVEDGHMEKAVLFEASSFSDKPACWQNAVNAVELAQDKRLFRIGKDELLAAAVVQKSGNIMLLCVREDCRGQGMAESLLSAMSEYVSGGLKIINVDESDTYILSVLSRCNFKPFAYQFEMCLPLV